ncbi:MAG: MFS transporter [Leptolyngbyaceae cyanobacterium]
MSSDYSPTNVDANWGESSSMERSPAYSPASPVPSPPPPPEPSGFGPVLQNRNFLVLWIGQVFSQLADKVYLVLMIAIIANRFQASDQSISGWVSALMITFTIPAVLFGFLAGVFVDRWQKKSVLVISNLLRGLLVIALPLIFWLTQGWGLVASIPVGFLILLGVTFLVSTLTQFFAPAEQSAIPLIVPRHHLLSANSLYTTTMMASVIVGFALGEPVLALADTLVLHLNANFDAAVLETGKELLVGSGYGIAGLILLLIQTQEKRSASRSRVGRSPSPTSYNGTQASNGVPQSASEQSPHLWRDMKDGLRFLNQSPSVRAALIQLIILFSIVAALAVLAVRLAEVIPVLEADQFGFLLAAGGVGMALGAAVLGQFGQRLSHLQLTLIGGVGLALCLMILAAMTHQLIPALLCIGGVGLFTACIGIPMQTTIQAETPESMRGKVFGLQNNAVNIALSLPLAIAGIAETLLGLPTVLLGLSGLVITGSLLTWYSASKVSAKA